MQSDRNIISFIETLKVQDGALLHVEYHNRRFNATRKEFFGFAEGQNLLDFVSLPRSVATGIFKCRVRYDAIVRDIRFEPYRMRKISSLKLVEDNTIDYRFKYADRSSIESLYALRGECDDILILREGLLTDTSYANIAFWDGSRWITPRNPLLGGTCRARLLDTGELVEGDLKPGEVKSFRKIRIFNAMMDQVADMKTFRIDR